MIILTKRLCKQVRTKKRSRWQKHFANKSEQKSDQVDKKTLKTSSNKVLIVLTKRLCKLFWTRSDHVAKKILPKNIKQSHDLVDKKILQKSFNKGMVLFTKRLANKFKQRSDHVDKKKKSKPCWSLSHRSCPGQPGWWSGDHINHQLSDINYEVSKIENNNQLKIIKNQFHIIDISAHLAQQNPIVHCLVHVWAIFLQRQLVVHILNSESDQFDEQLSWWSSWWLLSPWLWSFRPLRFSHHDSYVRYITVSLPNMSLIQSAKATFQWKIFENPNFSIKSQSPKKAFATIDVYEPAPLQQALCGHSSDDRHRFIQSHGLDDAYDVMILKDWKDGTVLKYSWWCDSQDNHDVSDGHAMSFGKSQSQGS